MATFKAPYGVGTVTVPDDRADRYRQAGWVEEKPAPKRRSATKDDKDSPKGEG
jgi:hypothetical protein